METIWHPAQLLQTYDDSAPFSGRSQLALIVLNQPLRDLFNLNSLWSNCTFVSQGNTLHSTDENVN